MRSLADRVFRCESSLFEYSRRGSSTLRPLKGTKRVYPFFLVARGSRKQGKIDGCSFERKKFSFRSGPAGRGKTAQLSASGGDAMARDNDRYRILCHSLPHFLRGAGLAGRFGNFAVSAGLARGDLARGFVDLTKKRRNTIQVNGNIAKVLRVSLKMLANFLNDSRNLPWRDARLIQTGLARDARFRGLRSRLRKLNSSHDPLRIRIYGRAPSDAARSKRRFKKAVSGILHKANPISRASYLSMLLPRYPLLDAKSKVAGSRLRPSLVWRCLDRKRFALLTLPPRGG